MYFGVVETESLKDSSILKSSNVVKTIVEDHPEAGEKIWHVNILKAGDEDIENILNKISGVMKNGWFSIFWNNEKVYVVMSNKIFKLKKDNWTSNAFTEFKNYAIKNEVEEFYLDFNKNFKYYNRLISLL